MRPKPSLSEIKKLETRIERAALQIESIRAAARTLTQEIYLDLLGTINPKMTALAERSDSIVQRCNEIIQKNSEIRKPNRMGKKSPKIVPKESQTDLR